jgi:hypothetical protein
MVEQGETMSEPAGTNGGGLRLHCMAGQPAPAEVVSDFQRLSALPDKARQSLWELVEASLANVDPALERRAEAFCQLYGVPGADVQASLRVCRFLLGRAAALDLPIAKMVEDLAGLSGGQRPETAALILANYEGAKAVVRRGLVERMILDHGKVLTGLDWRVDKIAASARGVGQEAPVVLLTLRLRDGDREERSTFYLTPEAFAQMKNAWTGIEAVLSATTRREGTGEAT